MFQSSSRTVQSPAPFQKIQKIVVPLAADGQAIEVLKYATSMAYDLGAELSLIHVRPENQADTAIPIRCSHIESTISWDQLLYAVRLWQIREYPSSEEILPDFVIENGELVPTILDFAERQSADLILMGTAGVRSQIYKRFGSVAAELIRTSHTPVWVIPNETSYQPIRHIAYAAQFEQGEYSKIDAVQHLAETLEADLCRIHIHGESTETDFQEMDLLEDTDLWKDQSVEDGLLHFMNQQSIDLLVMATHTFSAYDHVLSHTREVMFHTATPLLVLPSST